MLCENSYALYVDAYSVGAAKTEADVQEVGISPMQT